MSLQQVPTLTNSIFRSEKEAFHAGNENFSALSGCSVHRDLSWCCIPLHSQKCNRAPCTILFRQKQAVTDYSVDPKTCCGKSNVRCRGFYFNSHSREEQGGKGKRRLLPRWWWNSCQETESQPVRTSYILLEKEILPRTNPSLLTPPPILCQWILLGTAAAYKRVKLKSNSRDFLNCYFLLEC